MKRKMYFAIATCVLFTGLVANADDGISPEQLKKVRQLEKERITAINRVIGSVIAVYDDDRQGGGSGVIIDPSGIALTNHHVISGAGVSGWGGLADGKLYRWKLIGTDPGGDVSIIQMIGEDFPFTPLGDSDQVRVGDWALAMGNPFVLTEDQKPTVTLGIVSGVKRYQPGAGSNQLVYGNCIQVDSSINPGNSGGPLFNLNGEVIGINGRASFKERGRVNVGLGYAISANQIKNFIPDLLATKLVEHATLDASFSDRKGKVLCSTIDELGPIAKAGLELGDELLEFEGVPIENAHQFTNLICTLPEDWPVHLVVRKKDGKEQAIHMRALGLPYNIPKQRRQRPQDPDSDEEKSRQRDQQMASLMAAKPGTIRNNKLNRVYATRLIKQWHANRELPATSSVLKVVQKRVDQQGKTTAEQTMWLRGDGALRVTEQTADVNETIVFDGSEFGLVGEDGIKEISSMKAKRKKPVAHALAILAANQGEPFQPFGKLMIDGSDKSQSVNAYRLKVVDRDEDPFFFWLRMYNDNGRPEPELLKISSELDGNEKGAISYADWKTESNWRYPASVKIVRGIAETPELELQLVSAEVVESQDDWFAVAESTAEKNEDDSTEGSKDSDADEAPEKEAVQNGGQKK